MSGALKWLRSEHPDVRIVVASRELIDSLLAMNTKNRKVKRTHIERLVSDLKKGAWHLTASGVGVSVDGVLLDGQHRLIALKEADYPAVQLIVAVGLKPESQMAVDRHTKRSMADALTLATGRTIGTNAVAATTALLRIRGSMERTEPFAQRTSAQVSDTDVAEMLMECEEDLRAIISAAGDQRAAINAALLVYHRHHPSAALEFADQLKRQVGLTEDAPAYRLARAIDGCPTGGVGQVRAFGLTASACMAHSQGRPMKILRASESWEASRWTPWSFDVETA